jgi:hypothetical protein
MYKRWFSKTKELGPMDETKTNDEWLMALAAELELIVFSDRATTTPQLKKSYTASHVDEADLKPFSQLT